MEIVPAIIVHGGAYDIQDERVDDNLNGVCKAAREGYEKLVNRESCVDAVVAAISALEDDPTFDAGYGSVLTADGQIEMDCLLMRGCDLTASSVMCLSNMSNPIQLSNILLQTKNSAQSRSRIGHEADKFSIDNGFPMKTREDLITDEAVAEWNRLIRFKTTIDDVFKSRDTASMKQSHDTVGCVAIDKFGNLACGTSTGGITAKLTGRVGDSPLVGCGGYCDNNIGGVSTTGHGEAITKFCLAYEIVKNIELGMKPEVASRVAVNKMDQLVDAGHGGAIAIDCYGNIGMYFNTPRMVWASMKDEKLEFGINSEDHPFTSANLKDVTQLGNPRPEASLISQNNRTVVIVCEADSKNARNFVLKKIGLLEPRLKSLASGVNSKDIAVNMVTCLEKVLTKHGKPTHLYNSMVCDGMDGASVSGVSDSTSPVHMANLVCTKTNHTLMVGPGVSKLHSPLDEKPDDSQPSAVYPPEPSCDEQPNCLERWLVSAMVVCGEESACAVTETYFHEDTHANSLGCRAYAKKGTGVAVAVGSRNLLSRFLLAKEICNLLDAGVDCGSACRKTVSSASKRVSGYEIGLVAIDHQGSLSSFETDGLLERVGVMELRL